MSDPAAPPVLLEIVDLSIALEAEKADRPFAVEKLNLSVRQGEIVCIVGESGSGKSMIAHSVMGLLPKRGVHLAGGHIRLTGRDLTTLDERSYRDIRGRDVAMIFQEPLSALNPLHRIGSQIDEVFRIHANLPRGERRAKTLELLEAVGLPDPQRMARSFPFQLSGGQRQRAMIAMALALRPSLLIADEPTTALDVTAQIQILRLIKNIQREMQMGVLFITHDFGVVSEIADRVVVMQHGRIVEEGPVDAVLRRPAHDYTRKLLQAVPGSEFRTEPAQPKLTPLLEVSGLNKSYITGARGRRKTVWAAKNLSLHVNRGETLGIVGESGSGKSTMARCVVRLLRPESGEIHFAGQRVDQISNRQFRFLRPKIQMVFQDPYSSLNPRQLIGEIIAEGPIVHGVPRAEARRRCLELLALVGLDEAAAERYPHEFSGGQRQRIGLARALALRPELIIADEPVSALDVSIQAQVLKLLDRVRRDLDLGMIFITHDLRVAAQISDRIAVMRGGEVVETGVTRDVFERPQHEYTRALLDAIPGRRDLQRIGGAH